jgi:hypothetical protein
MKITGIINCMFRPQKTLNKTVIKLYNTLALPALFRGSKDWTATATNARIITAAEMKYIWPDYKSNIETAMELKITQVMDKIQDYRRKWLQHINRMYHNRLQGYEKITHQEAKGTRKDN